MVVAITRSFNEADIVESSLRRMLAQVDHLIVGDNSTDGARGTIESMIREGLPITLHDDQAPNFRQREVMTEYAHEALEMGAGWVVPFDLDEVWGADEGRIADRLNELPDHVLIAPARLVTHCVTTDDDPNDPDAFSRMQWRNAEVLPLPKVACRARPDLKIDHGNHGAWFDDEPHAPQLPGLLGAHHFPYRSPEQFVRRVQGAWPQLKASGLPRSHGQHMWEYGEHLDEFGPEGLARWFANGMVFDNPAGNRSLVHDPLPSIAVEAT